MTSIKWKFGCNALVDHQQFLQAHEAEKWPDGTLAGCYRFAHTFYQAAIYQRLSAAYRLRCHQRLGALLETAYGSHANDIAAELARHFEHGRQYASAMHYHLTAGHRAMQQHAYREAVDHLSKGQELLASLDGTQERLQNAGQG